MVEHLNIPTPAGIFDAIAAGPETGRPVLLLHGFPQSSSTWDHQVDVLGAQGYRAVAPDQRGYSPGVRPDGAANYGMGELVGDVLAMADELGWPVFDLVGHDWGAAVGWWTAADHPDRLRSLTAVSTPHPAALSAAIRTDEDQHARSAYMSEWRNSNTEQRMLDNEGEALRRIFDWKVLPSKVDEYVRRLSEPGAMTAALNWYRAGRAGGRIDKVSVPTMYVWSTEDAAFGSAAAFDTENWVTGPYHFQMVEDVSHWIPDEASELMTSLLLAHLSVR
ncbi:alpha/beta fold hydrolase [Umezawaea tangerina]|uniref:Pimeloyl-ACP methyl ester carboxylesterase n=1 Tax=Umezawaea tangerina TaxID=84725 RepID=A0A2T0SV23_9PSEU|nr:alpha/beta hydrolase [Umezawaea tangerina]PRY37213.1 pimeloyl-ACP methyl ester carboxylesterase [Umezawaea tangerina]